MNPNAKIALRTLAVLLFFFLMSYFYLYPGTQALVEGRTDTFMSDGTDATSLPYAYDILRKIWNEHPSRYFYGSVYTDNGDPEHGTGMWMPWSERWLVLFYTYVLPIEQVATAFIATLLVINAFCMYLLGWYLGWPQMVSIGMGLAWGFNPYVRARAKVHGALTGLYHLPLIFLGLMLVLRGRGWKSLLLGAFALLMSGTTAHYYLVTCIFLSPLFLFFFALQPEFRKDWKRISKRFIVAILPLILFLGYNRFNAVPSDARETGEESMLIDPVRPGEEVHPFLMRFYAHPVDYLTGDYLDGTRNDWNPVRKSIMDPITDQILSEDGNFHERTNGIRWTILIFGFSGIVMLLLGKYKKVENVKGLMLYFFVFGLFTFWLASGPFFPTAHLSPSYWLYSIFTKVRVPNRAGINVHFAMIMLAGLFISASARWRKIAAIPGLLVAVLILDYYPVQGEPMSPIMPAYTELQRDKGPCGPGMGFPFFNAYVAQVAHYMWTQRMRGSDCPGLNQLSNIKHVQFLTSLFPPDPRYLKELDNHPESADNLIKIAQCVPLNWFVFFQTPRPFAEGVCNRLGWRYYDDGVCVAPDRNKPLQRYPEDCR